MLKKNLQSGSDHLVQEDILTHKRDRNARAATERQLQQKSFFLIAKTCFWMGFFT